MKTTEQNVTCDYIITGTGASGLMLAYHLSKDPFFDTKKIVLIDKEVKNQNDRTWCFWEKGTGSWDTVVSKSWGNMLFKSIDYKVSVGIHPYQYKMIRSKDFYEKVWSEIAQKENFIIIRDEVLVLNHTEQGVIVSTEKQDYLGTKCFNSIPSLNIHQNQGDFPILQQHFVGWFLRTKDPVFDKNEATFMDFSIPQKSNTRFMYVLPLSENEALVEYTLFSESLLSFQEYEESIKEYLEQSGILEYDILEKEQGSIPMTSFEFWKGNGTHLLHMGTAGGWTKASTGFTFYNIQRKVKQLILHLKQNENPDLSKFYQKNRFWYYDVLFLQVLYEQNYRGSELFTRMFRRNPVQQILSFLEERTSIWEEVQIMASMPSITFLKTMIKIGVKRLFG